MSVDVSRPRGILMAVAAIALLMLHDLSGGELRTLALGQLNAIVETLGRSLRR